MAVMKDDPQIEILGLEAAKEETIIYYLPKIQESSIHHYRTKWSKDGEEFEIGVESRKYVGGDLTDGALIITSPTKEDEGIYSCTLYSDTPQSTVRVLVDHSSFGNNSMQSIDSMHVQKVQKMYRLHKWVWAQQPFIDDVEETDNTVLKSASPKFKDCWRKREKTRVFTLRKPRPVHRLSNDKDRDEFYSADSGSCSKDATPQEKTLNDELIERIRLSLKDLKSEPRTLAETDHQFLVDRASHKSRDAVRRREMTRVFRQRKSRSVPRLSNDSERDQLFSDAEQRRKIPIMFKLRKSQSVSRVSNDGDWDELLLDASETMSNSSMDYVHMDTVTTISTPQEEESDYLDISDDYQDYSEGGFPVYSDEGQLERTSYVIHRRPLTMNNSLRKSKSVPGLPVIGHIESFRSNDVHTGTLATIGTPQTREIVQRFLRNEDFQSFTDGTQSESKSFQSSNVVNYLVNCRKLHNSLRKSKSAPRLFKNKEATDTISNGSIDVVQTGAITTTTTPQEQESVQRDIFKSDYQTDSGQKTLEDCTNLQFCFPPNLALVKNETSTSDISAAGFTEKLFTSSCAPTHPFSKGTHNQKDLLPNIIKAHVGDSVGLIHIEGHPAGTGFRVGEKYIVTCAHVIANVITVKPHYVDSELLEIEFNRLTNLRRCDPHHIFDFQPNIAYLDEDHDFVVLELKRHDAGVPFPPPLTCFGEVCASNTYFVGHPGGRQMMEDSDVIPRWSPNYDHEIVPYIAKLSLWSKNYFPDMVDYYSILLQPPRKILFHTTFDKGSSGSPGFIIKNCKACVIIMMGGGTPGCFYDNKFPNYPVEDKRKVEYGYALSDIYKTMLTSAQQNIKDLATDIFRHWI